MKNYYKILGVKEDAKESDIKQVYRQKAKLLHPDLNNNNPQAAEKLMEVNEAYETLSDPALRQQYDKQFFASKAGPQGGQKAGPQGQQGQQRQGANFQGQQINIEQMTANAFNQGYSKGYNDCSTKESANAKAYNNQIKILSDRLRESEEERAALFKKYAALEDKAGELEAQNEMLWIQVGEEKEGKHDDYGNDDGSKEAEYTKIIDQLNKKLKDLTEDFNEVKILQKAAETHSFEKEMELLKCMEENTNLKNQLDAYENYINSKELSEDIEQRIHEREQKMKQIRKLIKNTYYGTLGVVYWADNQEIFNSYNKLKQRWTQKMEKGDIKAKQKLLEIENAYDTLIDERARTSYNKTVDITDEDIEMEREEEREYNLLIEKYNDDKRIEEFWEYVDDLMFQAQTGEAEAQNTLGELYYYGDEIEKDLDQAFYWFKEAAKQQHPDALLNLGKCYLMGEGTVRDETKGNGFIRQAAKLGQPEAATFFKK